MPESPWPSDSPEVIPPEVAAVLGEAGVAWLVGVLGRLAAANAEVQRLRAENEQLRAEVARLQAENRELRARLGMDSTNSSRPPSSDPPAKRHKRAVRERTGRKRGAQPGHKGVTRELLPPEQVTAAVEHVPPACDRCGADLGGAPLVGRPVPHQVIELPEIRPDVIEHRLHAARCGACGTVTRATVPPEAAWGTGPRLTALAALLCGRWRVSREESADLLTTVLGVPICKGTVQACCERASAAVAGPVDELLGALRHASFVFLDESGWRMGRARRWLWVAVTAAYTVFAIHLRRGRDQLVEWFGHAYDGVVHSDRWSAYTMFCADLRQLCWAHLRRDLQAILDAAGEGKAPAEAMLGLVRAMFEAWARFKAGGLDRLELQRDTAHIRVAFETFCKDGASQNADRRWRAFGTQILKLWPAVFRFLDVEDIEPTNNAAEQAIRPAVLWRRVSQGTRSETGSTFVARILTITTTCRRQGRHPLDYLTEAMVNYVHGRPAPSLMPDTS